MSRIKVNVFLEDEDKVVTELMKSGTLAIDLGDDATIYIQSHSRHYDRFTELLLSNETAPGDQTGDGTTPEISHNPIVGDHRE